MAATGKAKGKAPMVEKPDPPPSKSRKGIQISEKSNKPEGSDPMDGTNLQQPKSARTKSKKSIGGVHDNINNIQNTTLYGTIIGEAVEVREIRKKIRFDWKFLEKGFQLIPMANNWFELRFDLPSDKDKVWKGRPFHILSQLLLVKQWRLDFDPNVEPLTVLDIWLRIPGLPTQFISNEILTSIVEENGLGQVLKIDAFNNKGARKRYPRVCVSVDLTQIPDKKVFVINERDELVHYPVWFEDFPEGCGSCGMPDHTFEGCPNRKAMMKNGNDPLSEHQQHESSAVNGEENREESNEWVKVASGKPQAINPIKVGHSKSGLMNCFGINARYISDSSKPPSIPTSNSSSRVAGNPAASNNSIPAPMMEEMVLQEPLPNNPPNDATMGDMSAAGQLVDPFEFNHDEELLDYGEELDVEGFKDMMGEFNQEYFDEMFKDLLPSMEFILPDLSNSSILQNSLANPPIAPANSPSVVKQFEHLEVGGSSNSESMNRKGLPVEPDTASSQLKGSCVKKLRYDT